MPHKLLLADDSVTIQRVIELTFADEDIQVLAVGDGKKAIASIQADPPDIVLADVGMPERDGYEVASFVKTTPELAHIPVLLLTGAFEPIDEARARSVGCDGVLVKPFEPQMVINRVKDLLAGRRTGGLGGASVPVADAGRSGAKPNPAWGAATAGGPNAVPAGSLEDYFDRLDAAFASMEGPGAPAADAPPSAPPVTRGVEAPAVQTPLQAHPARPYAQASPLPEGIADWDPDLSGDPHRAAPIDPPPIDLDPARGFAPAVPRQAPPPYVSADARMPVQGPSMRPLPAPPVAEASAPAASAPAKAEASAAAPAASAAASSPHPGAPPAPTVAPAPPAPPPPVPTLAEAFAALLSAEAGQTLAPSSIAPLQESAVDAIVQRVITRMTDTSVRDTVVDVAERLVREEIARIKSVSESR